MSTKKAFGIIGIMLIVMIAGCGKQQFDDPNTVKQHYIYLEDTQTGQIISDQVLYKEYNNGTAICGYALVKDEDECYKMLEDSFYTELALVQEYLKYQIQRAESEQNQTLADGTIDVNDSVGIE